MFCKKKQLKTDAKTMCYTVLKLFSFFCRVHSLSHCLSTLDRFVELYQEVPASFEVFAPVKDHLQRYILEFTKSNIGPCKEQNLPQNYILNH